MACLPATLLLRVLLCQWLRYDHHSPNHLLLKKCLRLMKWCLLSFSFLPFQKRAPPIPSNSRIQPGTLHWVSKWRRVLLLGWFRGILPRNNESTRKNSSVRVKFKSSKSKLGALEDQLWGKNPCVVWREFYEGLRLERLEVSTFLPLEIWRQVG